MRHTGETPLQHTLHCCHAVSQSTKTLLSDKTILIEIGRSCGTRRDSCETLLRDTCAGHFSNNSCGTLVQDISMEPSCRTLLGNPLEDTPWKTLLGETLVGLAPKLNEMALRASRNGTLQQLRWFAASPECILVSLTETLRERNVA